MVIAAAALTFALSLPAPEFKVPATPHGCAFFTSSTSKAFFEALSSRRENPYCFSHAIGYIDGALDFGTGQHFTEVHVPFIEIAQIFVSAYISGDLNPDGHAGAALVYVLARRFGPPKRK